YVLRPTYLQAPALATALGAIKSDAGDIAVVGSMLVLTDYGSHVRDMIGLARQLDVAGGNEGIFTIPVLHADATQLAHGLDSLLGPAKDARILVDERTNTLLVAATDAGYQRVKAIVDRVDVALEIEG